MDPDIENSHGARGRAGGWKAAAALVSCLLCTLVFAPQVPAEAITPPDEPGRGAESAGPDATTERTFTAESTLSNVCRGAIDLNYPLAPPELHVGDTVRVSIGLGADQIRGGTVMNLRRVRYNLDCQSSSGIACHDDGAVISYQGGLTTTCSVPFVADHLPGETFPNQVVFTPFGGIDFLANVRGVCVLEFNVRIESPSNDDTPDLIEQAAGLDASGGDGVCNTALPLAAIGRDSGQICIGPGCQTIGTSCEPLLELSYPSSPNLHRLGDTARAHITFGGGRTGLGVPIVVHRVRFDLDCQATNVGINCPDDGNVVSYQGNLSTSCPVEFTSSHAPGDSLPNQVLFTSTVPFQIPANTPDFCSLDFDIRLESHSNDGTPDTVEQSCGCEGGADDALCEVGGIARSAEETGNGIIQFCPVCSDGNPCNGIESCDGETGCLLGTPPVCDDGNPCTDDSCDPASGCTFVSNGTCNESPKGGGYWKRLCRGEHPSGEYLTPFDVACVARACPFADVASIEDLCSRLTPDPPNDACAKAEADLLALELNVCRGRVSESDPIHSSCGSGTTVGVALERLEAVLCDPSVTPAQCRQASCGSEGLAFGRALGSIPPRRR
jgi:hypothetical protein